MQDPRLLVEKMAAIRALPAARELCFFVNARTDVFLRGKGSPAEQLAEAIRRLQAYEAAGADGLFAPGLADPAAIAQVVAAVHRPLNVMAFAGVPPAKELERLGVARVSVGAGADARDARAHAADRGGAPRRGDLRGLSPRHAPARRGERDVRPAIAR